MSPETLKMVREALETIADYADPQPRFTDADDAGQACYEIGKVASRAIAALEAATPAGPSEREKAEFRRGVEEGIRWADINVMRPEDSITDCVNRAIAALPPAPTDKESK